MSDHDEIALAQFRNPGDIQRVEETGNTVRYKRVMQLSPGSWTDAGSEQTVDYSPDGIRASAENWVDMDAIRDQVPDWRELNNRERTRRLRELDESVMADSVPINLLHGPSLYSADSLDEVGEVPADSVIVDDDGRLYGDLVLHGESPQSETAIDLMDEVLEASQEPGVQPPPVGPSVEIPADDIEEDGRGTMVLKEAWFSAIGVVFNPASRPVELGAQAAQRAVALQSAGGESAGVVYRTSEEAGGDGGGDTLIRRLRHRWRMADSSGDTPAFEDMSDDDLRRTLETMQEDMNELEHALQGDEDFAAVAGLVDEFLSEADPEAPASEFASWVEANAETDADVGGVLNAYVEDVGADSLEETSVGGLQEWLAEQSGDGDDGDGDEEPGGDEGPSMEDLENVKETLGQFADHMSDIKDMLAAREGEREEELAELERRLSDVEDEPVRRGLERGKDEPFVESDGDGGVAAEGDHEDVFL